MKRGGGHNGLSLRRSRYGIISPLPPLPPPLKFLASLSRAAAAAASSSHLSLFLLFLFDVVVTSFLTLAIHFFSLPFSCFLPFFHSSTYLPCSLSTAVSLPPDVREEGKGSLRATVDVTYAMTNCCRNCWLLPLRDQRRQSE